MEGWGLQGNYWCHREVCASRLCGCSYTSCVGWWPSTWICNEGIVPVLSNSLLLSILWAFSNIQLSRNPNFHHHKTVPLTLSWANFMWFTSSKLLQLYLILSQFNLVCNLKPNFYMIHFNITCPSLPFSPKWHLLIIFSNKILYAFVIWTQYT